MNNKERLMAMAKSLADDYQETVRVNTKALKQFDEAWAQNPDLFTEDDRDDILRPLEKAKRMLADPSQILEEAKRELLLR